MAAHLNRYAVIGNPVAHSQSPFIHTEFARQTGQSLSYERQLCPLDGLADALAAFAAAGGHGCNITVPFKFQASGVARHSSPRARLAEAANVLRWEGDGWSADNTDGAGLLRDIERNAGLSLAGRRVLLVGAGGAAAGVLGPLLEAAPAAVVVANRSAERAVALTVRHGGLAQQQRVALGVAPLEAPGLAFDVLINATSSSLQGEVSPVPALALREGALVVDLMYGAAAAPFLQWAAAQGAEPRDGLGMLVEQAALAFHFWRGLLPDTAPVLLALRRRLEAAA